MSAAVTSVAPQSRGRARLASAAAWLESCASVWNSLTAKPGEAKKLEGWLAPAVRRTPALLLVFAAVAFLAKQRTLIMPVRPVRLIEESHYPWLIAGLLLTSFLVRSSQVKYRRPILLVASLGAAAYYNPVFALLSLAYFSAFYGVMIAPLKKGFKVAFGLASFVAVLASCDLTLFPNLSLDHPYVYLFGNMVCWNYMFRLCYFLFELPGDAKPGKAKAPSPKPSDKPLRYVDVVLYFMFAPFFVIVPGMLCIPRYDKFVASLDEPAKDSDITAIRYAVVGVFFVVAVRFLKHALASHLDIWHGYDVAMSSHQPVAALVLGTLVNPVLFVLDRFGAAYVLVAVVNVLGFAVRPVLDNPLASDSMLDWWRRWNIDFRNLLVDCVFYPIILRFRKPYVGIVVACVTLFIFSSTIFHWILEMFARGSIRSGAYPAVAGEEVVTCILVAGALVLERIQMKKKKKGRRPRPLRLADPTTSVTAWLWEKGVRAGKITITMALVCISMRIAPDLTDAAFRGATRNPSRDFDAVLAASTESGHAPDANQVRDLVSALRAKVTADQRNENVRLRLAYALAVWSPASQPGASVEAAHEFEMARRLVDPSNEEQARLFSGTARALNRDPRLALDAGQVLANRARW